MTDTHAAPASAAPADTSTPAAVPERGDPTWVEPALTPEAQTRRVGKTQVFFGPPLARLTDGQGNTLEISGKLNRTAERYLALTRENRFALSEAERQCLVQVCGIGYLSPQEIAELPLEVELTSFSAGGLDKAALAERLRAASFVELVALVESLGF